jgi:hypothetical protein
MIVARLGFVLLAGVGQLRAEVCEAFNSGNLASLFRSFREQKREKVGLNPESEGQRA